MINELIADRKISRYRLSQTSGIPYPTLRDICTGKTEIKKCSAETVYRLSKALGTTMEQLLEENMEDRPSFELFKSNICHRLKELGDIDFIIDVLQNSEIRVLFNKKMYPECLYLLAMTDYLCRINGVEICKDYNDIRGTKLSEPVFPAGVISLSAASGDDSVKTEALNNSIPEFIRFNIVESNIRDVN